MSQNMVSLQLGGEAIQAALAEAVAKNPGHIGQATIQYLVETPGVMNTFMSMLMEKIEQKLDQKELLTLMQNRTQSLCNTVLAVRDCGCVTVGA
jgi:hypothetical protein